MASPTELPPEPDQAPWTTRGNVTNNPMHTNNSIDNPPAASSYVGMSSEPEMKKASTKRKRERTNPVWAEGLKRMYDSVVDEEIPDEFVDLLKKLDQASEQD